jgi:hypothetical protein
MKAAFVILCLIGCAGCEVTRQTRICQVVDEANFQAIRGAKVWFQPYAPFHPFWPMGARGITDANGQAKLSLPADFWFYFYGVKADGYSQVDNPERLMPHTAEIWWVFYMKRNSAGGDH